MCCEIPLLSGLSVSLRNCTTDFSRSSILARAKRLLMCRQPLSKSCTGCLPGRHAREAQLLFASCSRHKEETPKHVDSNHRRCELSPTTSPCGAPPCCCSYARPGQRGRGCWMPGSHRSIPLLRHSRYRCRGAWSGSKTRSLGSWIQLKLRREFRLVN